MADFCKQCSIRIFGKDFRELAELVGDPKLYVEVICEGCGFTIVNFDGECVNAFCQERHGTLTVPPVDTLPSGGDNGGPVR